MLKERKAADTGPLEVIACGVNRTERPGVYTVRMHFVGGDKTVIDVEIAAEVNDKHRRRADLRTQAARWHLFHLAAAVHKEKTGRHVVFRNVSLPGRR